MTRQARVLCWMAAAGLSAGAGAASRLHPAPLADAEVRAFLQEQQARCTTRAVAAGQPVLVTANASATLVRPGSERWELRRVDRSYADGEFTVSFSDPFARRMVRLVARRAGSCEPAHCTRYTGRLDVAGPATYLQSFEATATDLSIEETCDSRQVDRLFYEPSWMERLFRALAG